MEQQVFKVKAPVYGEKLVQNLFYLKPPAKQYDKLSHNPTQSCMYGNKRINT